MALFENLSNAQKTRAALQRDVLNICKETCHFLGLEITKPATEVVAELVYKKLSVYGTDLEAFAKHAKRTTINSEDVKLLARRNPSLKSHLNKLVPNSASKEKTRKSTIPVTKQTDASNSKSELERQRKQKEVKEHEEREKEQKEKEGKEIGKLLEQREESMSVDDVIDLTM